MNLVRYMCDGVVVGVGRILIILREHVGAQNIVGIDGPIPLRSCMKTHLG